MRLVDSEDTGIFEGIDESGLLRLARPDGTHCKISAGDVFFPRPEKTSEE